MEWEVLASEAHSVFIRHVEMRPALQRQTSSNIDYEAMSCVKHHIEILVELLLGYVGEGKLLLAILGLLKVRAMTGRLEGWHHYFKYTPQGRRGSAEGAGGGGGRRLD